MLIIGKLFVWWGTCKEFVTLRLTFISYCGKLMSEHIDKTTVSKSTWIPLKMVSRSRWISNCSLIFNISNSCVFFSLFFAILLGLSISRLYTKASIDKRLRVPARPRRYMHGKQRPTCPRRHKRVNILTLGQRRTGGSGVGGVGPPTPAYYTQALGVRAKIYSGYFNM